jgi:hypothetical protein
MDDMRVHPYWQNGDREGYIAEVQRVLRSRVNRPVTTPVASRWFNVNTILMETADDLWIHREKEQLWWTISGTQPPDSEIVDDPQYLKEKVKIVVYYKKCLPWSSTSKTGAPLQWRAIHPKARDFLFTESTFQNLSPDNAIYAQTLINGSDPSPWHNRANWKAIVSKSGKSEVWIAGPLEKTAARMAATALATTLQSGQVSITQIKEKRFSFQEQRELEKFIIELIKSQDGLCALTGMEMILDGIDGDDTLRYSLDRIDSAGHYERDNLQLVCKFANQWKGATDNEEFMRLIGKIRAHPLA